MEIGTRGCRHLQNQIGREPTLRVSLRYDKIARDVRTGWSLVQLHSAAVPNASASDRYTGAALSSGFGLANSLGGAVALLIQGRLL